MPGENTVVGPVVGDVVDGQSRREEMPVENTEENNQPNLTVEDPVTEDPQVETEPEAAPGTEPAPEPPQESPEVVQLRNELAEIKAWRAEQEKVFAENRQREKEAQNRAKPQEFTDQEWSDIKKGWGFVEGKNEAGEPFLNVNPQTLIDRIVKTIDFAVRGAEERMGSRLHENTSDSLMQRTFDALEKRPNAPVSDIRQYSVAIKEYLSKRYAPKDWNNPDFLLDGYYWAKGRNMKDAVKRVEASREQNKRIVHPGGGKAPAKPAAAISSFEREMMAGIPEKEWIKARDGR